MTTASTMLARDRGSVTPLVIGMVMCLLLLTAGVVVAGSAFLAGQRLQNLCDGAANAAAAAATENLAGGTEGAAADTAAAAAVSYLATRGGDMYPPTVGIGPNTVVLTCASDVPIALGSLFGSPTLHRAVTAVGHPSYHDTGA